MIFTAEELGRAAKRNGLHFPEHVLDQLVAAIDSGKPVVLTGPPGTGKTSLAPTCLIRCTASQAMPKPSSTGGPGGGGRSWRWGRTTWKRRWRGRWVAELGG